MWVPNGRWGWGCCACWQWPSPAAGGRLAARVRRCGVASAAPRPETLRARASATSSSTVGAGAGRGMKASGLIPRAAPPALRGETWSPRSGRELHPPHLDFQRGRQPSSHCSSAESWDAFIANPTVAAPCTLVSILSSLGDCIPHLKDSFSSSPHTNVQMTRMLHFSRSFLQRSIS